MGLPEPVYDVDGITVYHGDCLELLPHLPAVDAVVTDPPFFGIVREDWDNQWPDASTFLAWFGRVADAWKGVLSPAGSLYCFAAPGMAARVELAVADRFTVLNSITWQKDFPCGALKYGPENFRSFVSMSERVIFAEHVNATGETLWRAMRAAGLTQKAVAALFPSKTGGLTGCVSNWVLGLNIPTPGQWAAMSELMDLPPYDRTVRPFRAWVERAHTDVWTFKPVARARLRHPCEKPIPLLTHMIESSTNEGDLVLDTFGGSGATAEACIRTGRRCILIEKDERYIPVIIRRLREAETPLFATHPEG